MMKQTNSFRFVSLAIATIIVGATLVPGYSQNSPKSRQVRDVNTESQIATAGYSYQMSPKWISSLGTAYDLGKDSNSGQSLTVTRIGADFLIHFHSPPNSTKAKTKSLSPPNHNFLDE
jgi:hypothetical protein